MTSINLNHLEVFCILSETLSFSKTAELLNTSQPAISRKIKILEENLGHELFLRNKKNVSLTQNGMTLKDKILPNYKGLVGSIDLKTEAATEINIGSIYEAGEKIFTPALGKLIQNGTLKKFNLIFKSANELINLIQSGDLDLILVHNIPVHKSINAFKVYQDSTYLIGPNNLDIDKLASIPLITYRKDDLFTENFLKKNVSKKIRKKIYTLASANSHRAMMTLAKNTNSFAVIPASSFSSDEKSHLVVYKKELASHHLYLCARHNFLGNKHHEYLVQELTKIMSGMI